MKECANQKNNQASCTCTYNCPRRGMCCECVLYHRSKAQIPGCFFTAEAERSYDRSVENFVKSRK